MSKILCPAVNTTAVTAMGKKRECGSAGCGSEMGKKREIKREVSRFLPGYDVID